MSIFWGEFVGTMLLILLGNGVVANVLLHRCKGQSGGWIVITAGWGFAVAIAVYVTGWLSGAHLNPAVTLGMILAGHTSWALFPLYVASQILGAIVGAVLVWLTYYSHWGVTTDHNLKLLCFATQPAIRQTWANFLTEVIGTAVLLVGILGIFNPRNQIGTGFAPYAVGILIFGIGLSLGGPTGYAINPARDLGPRIAFALLPIPNKGSAEWDYAWIPIFAPLVGAIMGTWLYQWIASLSPITG